MTMECTFRQFWNLVVLEYLSVGEPLCEELTFFRRVSIVSEIIDPEFYIVHEAATYVSALLVLQNAIPQGLYASLHEVNGRRPIPVYRLVTLVSEYLN